MCRTQNQVNHTNSNISTQTPTKRISGDFKPRLSTNNTDDSNPSVHNISSSAILNDISNYSPKKSNEITVESPFGILRGYSTLRGTRKSFRSARSDVKRKNGVARNSKIDSLPIWVTSPKNVKEIPGYLKTVCNRLLHVEKQIKKFTDERQGLLCSIWKLSDEGYDKFLSDPVLKSITSSLCKQDDDCDYKEAESEDLNSGSIPRNHGKIAVVYDSSIHNIKDVVNYNLDAQVETSDGDPRYWKSSWLGSNSESNIDTSCTMTPVSINKYRKDDKGTPSSLDLSVPNSVQKPICNNKKSKLRDYLRFMIKKKARKDPLDYFKNVKFSELSQMDINTWTSFFGLKAMKFQQQVKELERIRDYLIKFSN